MSEKIAAATEQISEQSKYYCEVRGIDVKSDTNLKRFGKLFCSQVHIGQYVIAGQMKISIPEENYGSNYSAHEVEVEKQSRRKRGRLEVAKDK